MSYLLGALAVLAVASAVLLVLLALRRARLLRAERRRARAATRLRGLAAALVLDGEQPPALPPGDADLMAGVLWDFSRQITGSGRDQIARYFEQVGLVDRQLAALSARSGWRRAEAAFVLGDACSPRAVPALIDRLRDKDPDVRIAATRSLGRLRATRAAGAIVDAMADQRIPLTLAGSVLIEIGAGAVAEITGLLRHPDARSRAGGVELLGILGSADDARRLSPLLADPDPSVRAQVCLALGRLGTAEEAASLPAMLADGDAAVRTAAAEALGELVDDVALADLLRHAVDDEFEPARAAATAAARIDANAVLDAATRPTANAHLAEAASRVRAARR